jgi:hypothetical protein
LEIAVPVAAHRPWRSAHSRQGTSVLWIAPVRVDPDTQVKQRARVTHIIEVQGAPTYRVGTNVKTEPVFSFHNRRLTRNGGAINLSKEAKPVLADGKARAFR